MAKSTTQVYRTVTLTLTEDEADWLQAVMQNPISPLQDSRLPEVGEHKRHREAIFTALLHSTIPPSHAPAGRESQP